jgi:alcohol dehydrogenase class IV
MISRIKNVTEIIWGTGSIRELGPLLKQQGFSRVLVITDPGLIKAGVIQAIEEQLYETTYEIFSEVEPNPSVRTVNSAYSRCQDLDAQALIAVGGGSPIDVAKAVGVLHTNGGSIIDYEGINTFRRPITPLIAIPTTSGTGSEVTSFTVITDTERNYKLTVGGVKASAKWAIVDPQMTVSMPPKITAATGVDALVHAIESYTSLASFHYSEVLALDSMRIISQQLRPAYFNGHNLEAREGMLLASLQAALAFNNTRLGNAHAISHPLSAFFGIAHGVANAILLPVIMEFNLHACPERFAHIAEALDPTVQGNTLEKAKKSVDLVRQLIADVELPTRIGQLQIDEAKYEQAIAEMASDAMKSGNIAVNPRKTSLEDVVRLYRSIY